MLSNLLLSVEILGNYDINTNQLVLTSKQINPVNFAWHFFNLLIFIDYFRFKTSNLLTNHFDFLYYIFMSILFSKYFMVECTRWKFASSKIPKVFALVLSYIISKFAFYMIKIWHEMTQIWPDYVALWSTSIKWVFWPKHSLYEKHR